MGLATVRDAYTARSADYIDRVGSIEDAAQEDREYILRWARGFDGLIIDVGCGPGQWTHYLHENGLEVEGVDPVPEFVEHARHRYPGVAYRIGDAGRLDVEDASASGVLAWYSLIHTAPDDLDAILTEFGRCLRAGGELAVGFCEGPELVAFDHAVTTAYFWPVDLLCDRVQQAGFLVTDTQARNDPRYRRPHGVVVARRRS